LRIQAVNLNPKTVKQKSDPSKSRFVKYSTSPATCQPESGLMGFAKWEVLRERECADEADAMKADAVKRDALGRNRTFISRLEGCGSIH